MNRNPRKERTPTVMKMYPILSCPIALIIAGMVALITKLTIQLMTVAILTALSCIISAMYNHVIGPGPNSNSEINTMVKMMTGMSLPYKLSHPIRTKVIAIARLHHIIIVFLPARDKNTMPTKVATKLTEPTRAVTVLPLNEVPLLKIVFE